MPWHQPFPRTCADDGRYYHYDDPYKWSYLKYGEDLKPEDTWGHLHERYNTAPIAILDREAWHTDVAELVITSKTLEEFYAMLEERSQQRLNELKSAIASVDRVGSLNFEQGTSLRRLSDAMRRLHKTASVYDAAAAFLATQDFVEEQLKELKEARAKERQEKENERAVESTLSIEEDLKTSSASEVQGDVAPSAGNISKLPNSPSPQSYAKPPSSAGRPGAGTNITSKDKKRKREETDGVDMSSTRMRSTSARPGSTGAYQPGEDQEASSDVERGSPTSQQKHSSQKTSIDQGQPTPEKDQHKFRNRSFSESENDGSTVVKAEHPSTANSPLTATSPTAGYSDLKSLASTQIENPRIRYGSLGWTEDHGPSTKPLPSGGGQQADEVHSPVMQIERESDGLALEPGSKNNINNRPAAGS